MGAELQGRMIFPSFLPVIEMNYVKEQTVSAKHISVIR